MGKRHRRARRSSRAWAASLREVVTIVVGAGAPAAYFAARDSVTLAQGAAIALVGGLLAAVVVPLAVYLRSFVTPWESSKAKPELVVTAVDGECVFWVRPHLTHPSRRPGLVIVGVWSCLDVMNESKAPLMLDACLGRFTIDDTDTQHHAGELQEVGKEPDQTPIHIGPRGGSVRVSCHFAPLLVASSDPADIPTTVQHSIPQAVTAVITLSGPHGNRHDSGEIRLVRRDQ